MLTLLVTAAASLAVTAVTRSERASGEPSATVAPAEGAAPVAVQDAPASPEADTRATASAVVGASTKPSSPPKARIVKQTPTPPSVVPVAIPQVAKPAASPVATSSATLVWNRAAGATAYDVELRRGDTTIYSTTSDAPQVVVPRAWRSDGTEFVLQPEDQLYVWPVADGRRARPTVDGALAMDTTDIARFVERRQSSQP